MSSSSSSSGTYSLHQTDTPTLAYSSIALALYSGETAMAWVNRVSGTFAGCVVGLLIWTIGAGGAGRGNPYAMVSHVPFASDRMVSETDRVV